VDKKYRTGKCRPNLEKSQKVENTGRKMPFQAHINGSVPNMFYSNAK